MARHFLDRGIRPDFPRPDDSTPVGSVRRPASSRESSMTLTHMSVMSRVQSTNRGTESFESSSFNGSIFTRAAASIGQHDDDEKSRLGDGQVGLMREPSQVLAMARKDQLHARLDIPILARNPHLRERFRAYKVSDYFDHRGCRRFVNLSLSFAAKQLPASGALGLVTSGPTSPHQRGAISARAYRLATQTVEVDRQLIRAAKAEELNKLEDADRFKTADVSARQEELLFVEVSEPRRYLPAGVKMDELLPPDTSAGNAREENRRAEKLNATLQDVGQDYKQKRLITSQHWRLDYKEAIEVARCLSAWMLTTGHSSSQGMERSVFCRFLLDLGIIHHQRIPYVWAVELFDTHARLLEVRSLQSPQDGEGSYIAEPGLQVPQARSYTVPVLCKWDCLSVIDIILRRWSYLMRNVRDQSSVSSEPPKKDGRRVSVSGAAASQQFLKLVRAASRHIATQWDSLEGSASSASFLDSLVSSHDRGGGSTTSLPSSPRNRPPAILVGGGRGEQKGGGGGGSPKGAASSRPRKGNLATVVKEERKDTNAAAITAWKRSRLLSGMLVEPEVLQVVEQYRSLFKLFFSCYVEKSDDKEERRSFSFRNIQALVPVTPAPSTPSAMSFVIFMRFCQDLRLVPHLLSYHEVLQIYHSAECLEYVVIPPSRSNSIDSLASSGDGMTATLSSMSAGQMARRARAAHSGRRKPKDPRKQKMMPKMAPVGIESVDVSEFSRPRLSQGAVPQYLLGSINPEESTSPRKFSGYRPPLTRSSSQHRSASKGSSGSPRLPVPSRMQEHRGSGGAGQDAVSKNPCEQSKDSIGVAVRKDSGVSVGGGAGTQSGIKQFGVAAFTESLLRLVFLYHELYGNPVQVSASSRAKALWLLTYIHSVLDHYHNGHERRARGRRTSPPTAVQETEAFVLSAVDEDDASPVEGVSKPLASVLKQVDLTLFQTPSYQPLQVIPAAPGGLRREEVQEQPPPSTAPHPLSHRSRTEHLAEESATKRVEVNDVMGDNFTFSELLLSKIFAPLVSDAGVNTQVADTGKHVSRTLKEDMDTLKKDLAGCHAEKCPLTPPPVSPQAQHLRQLIDPLFENCIAAPIKTEDSLTMQSSSQLG